MASLIKHKIIGYHPDCDKSVRKKMLTFGLTPGVEIEIVRTAPMGDPIEVKVRGFFLSLRKTEFDILIFEPPQNNCASCHGCDV